MEDEIQGLIGVIGVVLFILEVYAFHAFHVSRVVQKQDKIITKKHREEVRSKLALIDKTIESNFKDVWSEINEIKSKIT